MMQRKGVVRNGMFAVLCWAGLSLPVLAQGVGAIGGTIVDDSGAVLPGANLTLSSPGLIGGNQSTVSDAQGAYQFTRLVPGRYSVKAELQGFRATIQENIDVNADKTSRADLKLAIGAVEEGITVKGEAPLLDTTSALNQTVMAREALDALPTANDLWSIARLTPAVSLSRYDVGGREMIGQSRAQVHGSLSTEYGYLVDGMDINSYAGGLSFEVDSKGYQEINYQTSNGPAEQSRSGVQINMITKTGTNAFRGNGYFLGAVHEFNNVSGALRDQLLSGIPSFVLQANPDIQPGAKLSRLFDSEGNVSGPIKRDRLWFLGSVRFGEVYSYRVGSYNPDGTQLLIDYQLINTMAKLSWAVTPGSQFHFTQGWVRKGRFHVAETGTATTFFTAAATQYNDSRNVLLLPRWTSVLSPRLVMEAAAVTHFGQNNQQLQRDPAVQPGDIPRFDSVTRVNSVARGTYNINEGIRTNLAASLSYVAGKHNIKAGWQYVYNRNTAGGISTSNYPSGLRAIYRNGVPDSVNTYNTPTEYARKISEHGIYAQDKWTPVRKLTMSLGLRFETLYGWLNDGSSPLCQEQTIFIAAQCFPAVTGSPDWKAVVPRLSAVYDVFGDGRTAVKFSANRYRIPQDTFPLTINPILLTNDTRSWTDVNRDGIPQLDELGPSTGFNLGTTNRYDPNVRWPYANEISGEFEQQLPGEVVISAGYFYRGHRDLIGSTNLAVPRSSYAPLQVTEVVSGRQVTVYNQDPALRGKFDTVWSNLPQLDDSFRGVDLTVTKRMRNHWMMSGSVSMGKTGADIQGTADQNNPNLDAFRRGVSDTDLPVFAKMTGAYELPRGFSLGFNGNYTAGLPDTTTVLVNANTIRLTQVSQSLVVEPRGTTRLPAVKMVDINVKKTLKTAAFSIEPRVDLFNLFNAAAATIRVAQLGPTYLQPSEILGGRLVKVGVNVGW